MSEQEARAARRGRAARTEKRRGSQAAGALPYISRNLPVYDILSDEGAELIEANADRLLAEIGLEFRDDPETIAIWKAAGADVSGERVRFPKGMLRELVKTAPAQFVQHARNPERNVVIGGNNTVFAPVYGPPFVTDLDAGRRYGTIEDFRNFVKLSYASPWLHHSGGTVCEPVDLPVNKRHFDMVYAHLKYSDKPFMGSVTAPERASDSVRMAQLVFGEEFVDNNCVMIQLINANSPLVFDATMLGALKVYAAANQACIVSPFILAGAMSPVTVAGTLSQVLAEALAGCALTQLVRPGAPGTRMRGSAIATLTIEDANAIAELDNIIATVPEREGRETLRVGSLDYSTRVSGVSADWPKAQKWEMGKGAFFSADDQRRYATTVVLGETVASNLFPNGENPVGDYVFIGGAPFEVAGVLSARGATAWGQDMDDVALVPITTGMMRLFGQQYLSSITIAVEDTRRINETEEEARELLLARHGTEDFQLRNTASLLESVQETQKAFSLLLGSVAAISLLVGGIGVMNIMLGSGTERTREIGVRMATGARRSDIMVQFNTEALVVGGLGGVLGVLIGLGVSLGLGGTGMSIAITPEPAILAFSCALATGLVFGYLPARKAARMDPVAALASE